MGGSRRVTVGYRYFAGIHAIFCRGPIDKVLQVFFDQDRIAFSGEQLHGVLTIDRPDLFGGDSREGGVSGDMAFMFGGPAQTQDSYLVAQLGASQPAYRGVLGAVLRRMYLGLNPYLKKWGIKAQRIHVRQDGLAQWYDAKAEIPSGNTYTVRTPTPALTRWQDGLLTTLDISNYDNGESVYDPSSQINEWVNGDIAPNGVDPVLAEFILDIDGITIGTNWIIAGYSTNDSTGNANVHRIGIFGSATAGHYILFYDNANFGTEAQLELPYGQVHVAIQFSSTSLDVWFNGTIVYRSVGNNIPPNAALGRVEYGFSDGGFPSGTVEWREGRVRFEQVYTPGAAFSAPVGLPPPDSGSYVETPVDLMDMNPAHMIREALTDPDWGMGNPESEIDDDSFTASADTLHDEQMGMSYLWKVSSSVEDFVKLVARHIDATLYVDPVTAKYVLKLIRDDYDPNTLLELNPSNVLVITDFARSSFSELINTITAKYWDGQQGKDAAITISDIALASVQGTMISGSVEYEGFTHSRNASRAAQRELRLRGSPIISCTLEATGVAADLRPGSVFKLSWPEYQISSVIMRVVGMAFGDGKRNRIRLICAQDLFGLPSTVILAPPVPVPSTNPDPLLVEHRLVFEMPYLELVQRYGQVNVDNELAADENIGLIGAVAVRPQPSAINARLYTNSGAGYVDSSSLDFAPTAVLDGVIDEMATSFAIDDAVNIAAVTPGTWLQIDDEIVAYVSYSAPTLTVERGCLDTVPRPHLSGARLFFWNDYSETDEIRYVVGDTVNIKMLTVTGTGVLPIGAAPTDTVEFDQRALRPYPPGNFQIGGQYFPTAIESIFDVTWAHRDRLQQTSLTLISFPDASVGPEAGTTYNAYAYDDDTNTLIDSGTAIATTTWTPTIDGVYTLRIELESERDGLVSAQRQIATFIYIASGFVDEFSDEFLAAEDDQFLQKE